MVLPDIGLLHGRMMVAAWDYGLEGVEDNTVKLLMEAVEYQLKNLIMVTLARRVGYKLREKHFRYGMAAPLPESHLRNVCLVQDDAHESHATVVCTKGHIPTLRPSVETGSRDAAVHLSCTPEHLPAHSSITLLDLYDALQVHKSALPSHTVYATNMERISCRLWHPGQDEDGEPTALFNRI
jgi:transcriptional adapter 1